MQGWIPAETSPCDTARVRGGGSIHPLLRSEHAKRDLTSYQAEPGRGKVPFRCYNEKKKTYPKPIMKGALLR